MVGLANTAFDPRVEHLFPGAVSPLYAFTGSYARDSVVRFGIGYWIKLGAASEVLQPGMWLALPQSVPLNPGWNLVSSGASEPANVNSVMTTGTTLLSDFYGFNGAYFITTIIEPGHAYWVKSASRGVLTFRR